MRWMDGMRAADCGLAAREILNGQMRRLLPSRSTQKHASRRKKAHNEVISRILNLAPLSGEGSRAAAGICVGRIIIRPGGWKVTFKFICLAGASAHAGMAPYVTVRCAKSLELSLSLTIRIGG